MFLQNCSDTKNVIRNAKHQQLAMLPMSKKIAKLKIFFGIFAQFFYKWETVINSSVFYFEKSLTLCNSGVFLWSRFFWCGVMTVFFF